MIRALIVVGYLLVSATVASAECAWVLWENSAVMEAGRTTTDERPVEGYVSKRDCDAAKKDFVDSARQTKSVKVVVNYRCLPDTIDPRGPKGK